MQLDLDAIYNLSGKAVIVTGAAQGMGEAIARAFAGMDARVMLADISGEQVQARGTSAATP
jgi:NAD(P)-dependent dehydrogenase (short-subunit alcohol dehydrogenase family)